MGLPLIAGIGAGLGFAGNLASAWGQYESNKKQISSSQLMQQRQFDFEERMSNSAHQREVADLKLAGLNPILSANHGGLRLPVGIASIPNAMQGVGDSLNSAASAVSQGSMNYAQVKLLEEQKNLASAQKLKTLNEVNKSDPMANIMAEANKLINSGKSLRDLNRESNKPGAWNKSQVDAEIRRNQLRKNVK